MTTEPLRLSNQSPNQRQTLSQPQYEALTNVFIQRYHRQDGISHSTIKYDCERLNLKPPSEQSIRDFTKSSSRCFSIRTLDVYCILLFNMPFSEWAETYPSTANTVRQDSQADPSSQHQDHKNVFQYGLIKAHLEKPVGNIVRELLATANDEIWLFDYSLSLSLAASDELFSAAIKRGIKIRALFFNPANEHIDQYGKNLGRNGGLFRSTCETTLELAISLYQKINYSQRKRASESGYFAVRITDNFPRMACYISDPHSEGTSYFVPSINQRLMLHMPVYEFRNIEGGVYQVYLGGLQEEWATAMPLHSFLEHHPEYLQGHPSFLENCPQIEET